MFQLKPLIAERSTRAFDSFGTDLGQGRNRSLGTVYNDVPHARRLQCRISRAF